MSRRGLNPATPPLNWRNTSVVLGSGLCHLWARSQISGKPTVSFVMSVCLSVCLSAWNDSAPTGRIFVKFEYFSKICGENSIFIKTLQV